MVRFNRILVPTDFSDCADEALSYAAGLARRHHAELHIMHARMPIVTMELPVGVGSAGPPVLEPEEAAADQMAHAVEPHDLDGLTVELVTRRGPAAASIVDYAVEADIDLIVMGTHGRSGVPRFFLGSVAEHVVRRAPMSVLTIRSADGDAARWTAPPRRLLVPIDFTDRSSALLPVAESLAAEDDARVDLVHVIEKLPVLGLFTGVLTMSDLVPDARRLGYRELESMLARVAEPLRGKVHVEEGGVAASILEVSESLAADLILTTTHGRRGTEHLFLGSVAERLVRGAPCPVLIWRN